MKPTKCIPLWTVIQFLNQNRFVNENGQEFKFECVVNQNKPKVEEVKEKDDEKSEKDSPLVKESESKQNEITSHDTTPKPKIEEPNDDIPVNLK